MVVRRIFREATLLAAFITLVGGKSPNAESSACEELIECYAKSRAKTEECLTQTEKHECRNETLQSELKHLNDEKAKCNAILRKNPTKRSNSNENDVEKDRERGSRRLARKDKKNNVKQKACFREARKLRAYCAQLSKCCTVNKLCKVNTLVDEKIAAKRLEIKENQDHCRLEHGSVTKTNAAKMHKRGGRRGKAKGPESDV